MTMPDDPAWTEQEIEALAHDLPPYVPPLPGIDPGISQDPDLFAEQHATLFGVSLARAAVASGSAAAMVAAAVALLGMGENPPNHNDVTVEYNQRIAKIGDGPWCDMGITVEALHSGNIDAVCGGMGRGFAYTPAHAADFKRRGLWHYGLSGARPGDVVFFNWSRKKSIDDVEHVGLVEHDYSDGTVATIECNVGDMCRREHRDATYVVGYGRPPYTGTPQEDVLKTVVDLGAEKAQTIKAGKRGSLSFELEYTGGDPGKFHHDADKDGRYPSIFPAGGDAPYAVTVEVVLAERPAPGVELTIAAYTRDADEWERDIRGIELVGDRVVLHSNIRMSDQHKYRADVVNTSSQDVVVKRAYLFIAH